MYVIDRPTLTAALSSRVPVVHLGQPAAVDAVRSATRSAWVVVDLWCQRDAAAARLTHRGSADIAERLRVWDNTPHMPGADLMIDTEQVGPSESASSIDKVVRARAR